MGANAKKPRISIVIPCYKQAHFLVECLDSISAQTFTDWEAFVVDDASPDGKEIKEILVNYASRFKLIVHPDNRGLAAARNTGARQSSGAYLLFIDADDLIDHNYLQSLMECFLFNSTLDVAFGNIQLIGVETGLMKLAIKDARAMLSHHWIPGAGALISKSVWERVGGYCEDPILKIGNEDQEFWTATIPLNLRVIHTDNAVYYWRRSYQTMSSNLKRYHYQTRQFIYHRHRGLYNKFKLKRQFLADGYYISCRAAYFNNERLDAVFLALVGLSYQLFRRDLIRYLMWSLFPVWIYEIKEKITRLWS